MIYVHIPFCRSKCFYCGFFSTISQELENAYFSSLCEEVRLRKDYLDRTMAINSLYVGGGTPSLSKKNNLIKLMEELNIYYRFNHEIEQTIEVNPEDVTEDNLLLWKDLGFNRLSIGIQSFDDEVLKKINRRHSGIQGRKAVELAAKEGFGNISIDLIMGLPGFSLSGLENDLYKALILPVTHISTYILSIDPGSIFEKLVREQKIAEGTEGDLASVYLRHSEILKENGFDHYEISNFSRGGMYAKHNTGYWQQEKYIGLGPSAHSYNGDSRQWNHSHLKNYINSLNNKLLLFDCECLNEVDKYNEYIMTALRTKWGADIEVMKRKHNSWGNKHEQRLLKYQERGYAKIEQGRIFLTERGWLISDDIFSDLFIV